MCVILTSFDPEGVYPQSDRGLALVGNDASKGVIVLWVHLFVAIDGINRNGYPAEHETS